MSLSLYLGLGALGRRRRAETDRGRLQILGMFDNEPDSLGNLLE